MSRIFLSSRDVTSPAKAATTAHDAITEWRTTEVRNALGQKFRASVHVEVRQPWWMPGPLYRALMRTIVIEAKAERTR
jgi:hypothetical protein